MTPYTRNALNGVLLHQIPNDMELWDHTPCGQSSRIHLSQHQKPELILETKFLQWIFYNFQCEKSGIRFCELYGYLPRVSDAFKTGISVMLRQDYIWTADDGRPRIKAISVPVVVVDKVKEFRWPEQQYNTDLETVLRNSQNMLYLDLGELLKLRATCIIDGVRCDVAVEMASMLTSFVATPIAAVPTLLHQLSMSLTKSKNAVCPTGFLSMDSKKRLVFIVEDEKNIENVPLIGIWISSVGSPFHPYVWAACVRYISSTQYKNRLCVPPMPFLLVTYDVDTLKPAFYDCVTDPNSSGSSFISYSAVASIRLTEDMIWDSDFISTEFVQIGDTCRAAENTKERFEKYMKCPAPAMGMTIAGDVPSGVSRPYGLTRFPSFPTLDSAVTRMTSSVPRKGGNGFLGFPYSGFRHATYTNNSVYHPQFVRPSRPQMPGCRMPHESNRQASNGMPFFQKLLPPAPYRNGTRFPDVTSSPYHHWPNHSYGMQKPTTELSQHGPAPFPPIFGDFVQNTESAIDSPLFSTSLTSLEQTYTIDSEDDIDFTSAEPKVDIPKQKQASKISDQVELATTITPKSIMKAVSQSPEMTENIPKMPKEICQVKEKPLQPECKNDVMKMLEMQKNSLACLLDMVQKMMVKQAKIEELVQKNSVNESSSDKISDAADNKSLKVTKEATQQENLMSLPIGDVSKAASKPIAENNNAPDDLEKVVKHKVEMLEEKSKCIIRRIERLEKKAKKIVEIPNLRENISCIDAVTVVQDQSSPKFDTANKTKNVVITEKATCACASYRSAFYRADSSPQKEH